jgi:uncharacterized protein YcfJ
MNKSLGTALVAGAVLATTGVAIAGYSSREREPEYARVVHVMPVQRTISTPRQVCRDESVTQPATTEKRCETVYEQHIERRGYDVRYRIGDQEAQIRMDHDPGDRIPMRSGQLLLDESTGRGAG